MITRRQTIGGMATLGIVGPALAQTDHEGSVVVRTTGGVFEAALRKNFFEPFTKATGIKVIPIAASYGEMMARATAMQAAGRVEWDIISPQFYELNKLQHLLADLGDCGDMPSIARETGAGTCGRFGALYLIGGQVIVHSTTAFPNGGPKTWADFWDMQKFPGRRALPNTGSPWANLIAALIADGVEPAKLFPLDLDRAFKKLDELKPHVAVWWRTGDQSQQLMRSGDIAATLMWSGTAFSAKRQGLAIAWSWRNAVADFGSWGILKNAPHPRAARAFIDYYMGQPENHVGFAREMGYTTPNRAAQAILTAEEKADLGATEEIRNQIISPDADWLEVNRASALERWNRWLAA